MRSIPSILSERRRSAFWILASYIVLVFLIGGGSRADIVSLLLLRPLGIIACVFGSISITRSQVRDQAAIFGVIGGIALLATLSLVPLPPAVWHSLPGRELIVRSDHAVGLDQLWRPLTLAPAATRNALWSLTVPLGALILAVQVPREQLRGLLPVFLALGLICALLGVAQGLGASSLYFFRVTNPGMSVGLFANRNHNAVFLAMMIPMLAVYASLPSRDPGADRVRFGLSVSAGIVLLPPLLTSGSRAGLLVAGLGLASVLLLYRQAPRAENDRTRQLRRKQHLLWLTIGVIAIVAVTVFLGQAQSVRRLAQTDNGDETRFLVWRPILRAGWNYFPVGSGIGSFAEVYKIHEPDSLLTPYYLNHAHNDWIEVWLTTGLSGLFLLGWGLVVIARGFVVAFQNEGTPYSSAYARLGAVLITQLMIASLVDYPLRTPSIACAFVISLLWLRGSGAQALQRSVAHRKGHPATQHGEG